MLPCNTLVRECCGELHQRLNALSVLLQVSIQLDPIKGCGTCDGDLAQGVTVSVTEEAAHPGRTNVRALITGSLTVRIRTTVLALDGACACQSSMVKNRS